MSEPLKVRDVLSGREGWLYRVEEVKGNQVRLQAFSASPAFGETQWVHIVDALSICSSLIARAIEPPNIMTRIEKAVQGYLANEYMIGPKVVILGAKEWDELDKSAQEDYFRRPSPKFVTSQARVVCVRGLELRVVRDAERDSCLEVYG